MGEGDKKESWRTRARLHVNIGVYSPANQNPALSWGFKSRPRVSDRACLSASYLMQHHSLLRWLFSVLYRTTSSLSPSLSLSLSLSLSPSLSLSLSSHLSQTQSRTHKLLPLPASGFKAQLWRIHCDSTGFRAHWRRGREGEREMAMGGEKGVAWRRRQMNQREEKQQRWQQNQHHCIPSWHNWLYQRRFCKPLTSPLRVTRLHCNTGFERPHVCVCVCVYVCIMHDRVLAGVFSCGMFVVCIHWFILALSSGEICCGNQLGSRWVRLTTHEQERWVVCDNEMCCMLLYHSALQRQAAVTTEAVRLKWCEVLLGQSAHKLREKKKKVEDWWDKIRYRLLYVQVIYRQWS